MSPQPTGESSCEWSQSSAIRNMTRWLFKAPEHTWGTPGIAGWGSGNQYNRTIFLGNLTTPPFYDAAASWAEQRIYNAFAVEALEYAQHPLAKEARARYDDISNVIAPDVTDLRNLSNKLFRTINLGDRFVVAFDETGALVKLARATQHATDWASESSPIAGLVYQTLNESDWVPFTYDCK